MYDDGHEWTVVINERGEDALRSTMWPPMMRSHPAGFWGTRLESEGWMTGRWMVRRGDNLQLFFRNGELEFCLAVTPNKQLRLWQGRLDRPLDDGWIPVLESSRTGILDWATRHPWHQALLPQAQSYFAALDKGVASI